MLRIAQELHCDREDRTARGRSVKYYNAALQALLDMSTPLVTQRWVAWAAVLLIYIIRVYFLEGFYIVTYALGIYNLNLFLGFLTPLHVDTEAEEPGLPSKNNEEFRPFIRRLPEFKFW